MKAYESPEISLTQIAQEETVAANHGDAELTMSSMIPMRPVV